MTSEPRATENDDAASDPETTPASTGESLKEVEQRTAKVMADARKQVDRARETLHDQILSESPGGEEVDSEATESGPEKDDTTGAWPNGQ
jgi:hypothetical protein